MNRGDDAAMTQNMMGGPFIGIDGATESDMLAGVDPGVKNLVAWLRGHGFRTTDSGDGRTKFVQGFTEDDGVCPYAHVVMAVRPFDLVHEANRLASLLALQHAIVVEPLGPEEDGMGPPRIDASYCPGSGVAMIILVNVEDSIMKLGPDERSIRQTKPKG